MADHVAVAGPHEERALPEGLRQRIEPERGEELLRDPHHTDLVDVCAALEDLREIEAAWRHVLRRDDFVDVAPLLRP